MAGQQKDTKGVKIHPYASIRCAAEKPTICMNCLMQIHTACRLVSPVGKITFVNYDDVVDGSTIPHFSVYGGGRATNILLLYFPCMSLLHGACPLATWAHDTAERKPTITFSLMPAVEPCMWSV